MKFTTLFAALLCGFSLFAGPGDSTVVRAIDHLDMTTNRTYKVPAYLPSQTTTYNKILMVYTLGCASTGCSDWDYTTSIKLIDYTGVNDSDIFSIDTVSTNPLVLDTNWRVFEVIDNWELGRVITPYGGYMRQGSNGYTPNWEHPFVFDVTDYAHLLHDTVLMGATYSGYSSGFSATIDFIYIEGTPPRPVIDMDLVYSGYGNYIQSATFEEKVLPAAEYVIDQNAVSAMFTFTPTGHGFVNTPNCAEFCNRHFKVFRDGVQMAQHDMWRDDCGTNPIFPQGGTWLYDRANWCPGDDAIIFKDELGSVVGGDTVEVNVDIENYSYTVPAGETPAGYNVYGVFTQYGDFNIRKDAEITEIISPNLEDEYRRYNPACRQAMVRLTNRGGDTLRKAVIHYGLPGSWIQDFHWSGSLAFGESEVVTLPMVGPWPWKGASAGVFKAEVYVYGDEVAYNNTKFSNFEVPVIHPSEMVIITRSNAAPQETHWTLYDDAGNVVRTRDGLSANAFHYDTLSLGAGCYELHIEDRGEDGLSWWANNDGAGYVQLRNNGGSTPLFLKLTADFGTEYRHFFTVDGALSVSQTELSSFVDVAPNPSTGVFEVLYSGEAALQSWTVVDLQGRVVKTSEDEIASRTMVDISTEPKGMYILQLQTEGGMVTKKLVLN